MRLVTRVNQIRLYTEQRTGRGKVVSGTGAANITLNPNTKLLFLSVLLQIYILHD